jgi:hypothetical protein
MTNFNALRSSVPSRPRRPLRDDPRYHEIKKMIEEFPTEHLEELKRYIQRWSRNA